MTILAALALATAVPPTAQDALRGEVTPDGRHLFRAIPFARPPVGPLRWKPPQPVRG